MVNVTSTPASAQTAGIRPKPILETEKQEIIELHPIRFGEVSARKKNRTMPSQKNIVNKPTYGISEEHSS